MPVLRKIAFKFAILDVPNQPHKTHMESIPYLGGLSIVIPVMFFSLTSLVTIVESSEYQIRIVLLLIPSLLLTLVGLYDDMKSLSPASRFLVQTLVSVCITIFLWFLGYQVQISSVKVIDFVLSVAWLVGITNAFNLFDNLDGGAAGISAIASFTIFILSVIGSQYLIASFSVTLMGASLGFLFWNRNPARIYLGDSGALFIGFFLALSLLQYESQMDSRLASAFVPIFVLALPIIDTSVVTIGRVIRGVSIFQGGKDHLSHRLVSMGNSRKKAALTLWKLSTCFSILGVAIALIDGTISSIISLFGFFCMILLIFYFVRIRIPN